MTTDRGFPWKTPLLIGVFDKDHVTVLIAADRPLYILDTSEMNWLGIP